MAIPRDEAKMVLALAEFVKDDPWIICDVGSNKGEWFDELINYRDSSTKAGQYQVWSVEPNQKLLSYQQVKYDYNDNINYVPFAACEKKQGTVSFWYWENRNSGLSSILLNKKWSEDPIAKFRKHTEVPCTTVDSIMGDKNVDFLKIDVEGAESQVIVGCKELLKEKRVKFIQIEYSDHYKWGNFTFKSIINFVSKFGYYAWSWDGERFNKIDPNDFVEDFRLENFVLSHIEIGKYHYTQLWNSQFIENTKDLPKPHLALEIGCFEGLTSNYICDHLLDKTIEGSRLICIDPLQDFYLPGHKDNDMFVGQYDRFVRNTKDQPIELKRKKSVEAFPELKNYAFDFVYVDGDHTKHAVYFDATESFKLLKSGGHILFDDYGQSLETKEGIDLFIQENQNNLDVVIKNYQVLIKKK